MVSSTAARRSSALSSSSAASVQNELLTESDLTSAFTQDGAADAVRGLAYGEEVNGLFTCGRTETKPDPNAVRSVNAALAAEFAKVTR